jgi:hypothetical protein
MSAMHGAEPFVPKGNEICGWSFILVAFVFADPAAAQNWQKYSYPNYSFRVTFPASPPTDRALKLRC